MSRSNSNVSEQTNHADAGADPDSDPGFPLDILLKLDRTERRGLREQLQQHLRSAIQQGRLPAGTLLPPSRTLARDLGVARSVVVDAYEHLAADGYLQPRQGSGTRVLPTAHPVAAQPATSRQPEPVVRFIGGLPDPAFFPRAEWLRHYRAAINSLPNRSLGYPGPLGAAPLREALTGYVARVRGVAATPDQVMITAGLTQGVVLLCRALRARGVEAIAVEDPCFGFHRQAISNAGLRAVPIPVDDDGLDVARLPDQRAGHRAGRSGRRRAGGAGPFLSDRGSARPGAPRGARRVGPAQRRAGHRGRLRRGVPVRPCARRRPSGTCAGPGGVRRLCQQDAYARIATRVDHVAAQLVDDVVRGEAVRRHGKHAARAVWRSHDSSRPAA